MLLLLLAAAVSLAAAHTPSKSFQIPLKRHAINHYPEHRARHLLQQQDRIRRRLLQDSARAGNETIGPIVYNEVPLGVGIGTHYAELYLGIPVQKASVIVDTGSHLTAFPCNTCHDCGQHTDPLFDVSKSTTAKYLTCHDHTTCTSCAQDKCYISQSYTEGSMWSAVMIDDLAWLGGMNDKHPDRILKTYGVRFPVGCQTKETGLFIKQKENGIMGLGRDKATIMSYMLKEKRIEQDVFAMCFSPTGGGLVLGGIDYSHHHTKVAYTPLVTGSGGWYPVKVKDILVGDKTLGVSQAQLNSGRGVIVDSGTTDTFFPSSAARAFAKIYSDLAGTDYSEDYMSLSVAEVAKLPNITIVLEGSDDEDDIELEIPSSKYLSRADDGSYYGNFHFTERSGGVLGASTMVGYDVIFDMEKKRIGFAESLCDAVKSRTETFAPPHEGPNKGSEPVIEETPSTTPSNTGDVSKAPSPTSSKGASASNESTGASTASSVSSFFGPIVLLSVVGIAAVVAFKRLRKSSWAPLADGETGRGSPTRDALDEAEAQPDSMSPPRRNAASPPSGRSPLTDVTTRRTPPPRFTIGSDSESENGGSPRATTEL